MAGAEIARQPTAKRMTEDMKASKPKRPRDGLDILDPSYSW
jgi:hypothetical protein